MTIIEIVERIYNKTKILLCLYVITKRLRQDRILIESKIYYILFLSLFLKKRAGLNFERSLEKENIKPM